MQKKMGRPTNNPKTDKITVRLDKESSDIMYAYCKQENIEKGEAVRRGLKKLKADIKNRHE